MANFHSGGIRCHESSPTVTNCIVWGNTPDEIRVEGGSPAFTFCNVQGGFGGEGNIDADPLFVGGDDYHLTAGSPCIDVGSNAAPELPDTDFEGDSRIINGDSVGVATVDMGADEYPDTISPKVSSTNPPDDAADVAVNTAITATFSEAMDASTITTAAFLVNDGTGDIAGTVTCSDTTAKFKPEENLGYDITYTVTVTAGIKDLAGNALDTDYTWSFTAGSPPDITPPEVSFSAPANDATDVAVNANITATFSEAMDASSITTATFLVNDGTSNIAGTVTYSDTTAKFSPGADLADNTVYTGTITTGVKDLTGNALEADYTWTFTAGSAADITPPEVSSAVPANDATDVAVNSNITATFSETMDASTVTTATFFADDGADNIAGTVTYSDMTATFVPEEAFAYETTYTVTITTGVMDLAGNALEADYTWSFTTTESNGGGRSGSGGCFISTTGDSLKW